KVLFALVQRQFGFRINPRKTGEKPDDEAQDYDTGYDGYLITVPTMDFQRSQRQQNKILVAAGYDMVLDKGRTPLQAVININEPEQAIFLTKRAYDVVDVFRLPNNVLSQIDKGRTVFDLPKIMAGMIAKGIDDKVSETLPDLISFNIERFRRWMVIDKFEDIKMDPRDPTSTEHTSNTASC